MHEDLLKCISIIDLCTHHEAASLFGGEHFAPHIVIDYALGNVVLWRTPNIRNMKMECLQLREGVETGKSTAVCLDIFRASHVGEGARQVA